jgi:hypothetical protein
MKALVTALVLAAVIAAPVLIQPAAAQTEVIVGGKYVGADPDANVRLQLRRDAGSEGF